MSHDVLVRTYAPTGAPLARIAAFTELDLTTVCDGGVDAGTITLPLAHPDSPALATDGNRVAVFVDGIEVTTGVITEVAIDSNDMAAVATVTGDWDVLNAVLASPIPEADPTNLHASQAVREYKAYTGAAEDVAIAIIAEQVARAGYAITTPTPSGAGPYVAAHARWETVMEDVAEFLRAAGGTWRIRHSGGAGTTPATCPLELVKHAARTATPVRLDSPAVERWRLIRKAPSVTRCVTAADGTGTDRQLYGWLTKASVAGDWSDPELVYAPREKFIEARNAADFLGHQMAAKDELAKGRGGTTLDMSLVETDTLRWHTDWRLGDAITVTLLDGTTITDRITSVNFKASADDGVTITPKVGDTRADPIYASAYAQVALARELSKTKRR